MSVLHQFKLDGQVAVVTGGQGKLGGLWTQTLLEAGASVAVLDLPQAPISETQKQLQQTYGNNRVLFVKANITEKAELEAARDEIETQLGVVSILVNNAGIDQPPSQDVKMYHLYDVPQALFQQVLEVNITGAFMAMQVFGESMIAHRISGQIINIGSLYASVSPNTALYSHIPSDPPFLKPPAYGASKAALYNLTQFFATHWAPQGIRVNMLSPGGIEGGQDPQFKKKFCERVPMNRMGELQDLQGPLLFLASDASGYVTGINLKVDGGFTLW